MAKIFTSFNVVSTSDIILVYRERSDMLSEVHRQFYAAPHSQRNITVDNLNPVMHAVQIWSTVDGTTLLQLKGQCDIDASISTNKAFDYIQFIVDRGQGAPAYDPASGQGQYVNADLDGKDYLVFKPGYGPLLWGLNIQAISGGGFEFIDGQEFSNEEEYTVLVAQLDQQVSGGTGKSYPEDVVSITANTSFGTTHYNKLLEISASSPVTITITDMNAIPNGTKFGINTHNGTQKFVTLVLPATKYCLVNGVQRNPVYIGRAEEAHFIKKGDYLRINTWDGDHRRIGQVVQQDATAPFNGLANVGGWYLKTDYPRLFNWYVNELPMGETLAGTDDSTPSAAERTKWIIGATKFWMPDTGGYFMRNYDPDGNVDSGGVRPSGDLNNDLVGPHVHPSVSNIPIGSHAAASSALTGVIRFLVNTFASGGVINSTTNTMQINTNDGSGSGTETRPKNTAIRCYRIT